MNNRKSICLFSLLFLLVSILFSSKSSNSFWKNHISPTASFERPSSVTTKPWHQTMSFLLPNSRPQRSQIYIVHVEEPKGAESLGTNDIENWHRSFLPSSHLESGEQRLVYSYTHVISGFAAWLTPNEAKAMETKEGFLLAYPDSRLSLRTTRSPVFMGLIPDIPGFWSGSDYGKGIVIGVIDTGVAPSHPSFNDAYMPEVPEGWKGECHFDPPSLCNKKIIAAYGFVNGKHVSPLDTSSDGHGTNTASIAAGNFAYDAEVLKEAQGIASGIAPIAHLAIYKVCPDDDGCAQSDIFQGINQALKDGVDVLSISIGDHDGDPFYKDAIAIGSFRAIDKKVFVSCSAGNDGPTAGTIENDAPWILTVGASTIDRTLRATVVLGNGVELIGQTAYQPTDFEPTQLPLVYPGARDQKAKTCEPGSLKDVKGKIVICQIGGNTGRRRKGDVVKQAGGAAMILMNSKEMQFTTFADPHVIPASQISYADSEKIQEYVKLPNPTATIRFGHTLYKVDQSPAVGSFSGRGPSKLNGGILKPDIIGPGVNILAATPHPVGPSPPLPSASTFDMDHGTSLSAPHLAGVAALLKVKHKDWTAAAIKSAIMTTADTRNSDNKPITDETNKAASLFAIGAGHANPTKADDPGLVYDINPDEYIPYLCGKYTENQVKSITGRKQINCSKTIPAEQLNYPSIALSMKPKSTKIITRSVTNVGEAKSNYVFKYDLPTGVKVSVNPTMLKFSKLGQSISYAVTFTVTGGSKGNVLEGQLRWETNKNVVKSPISISIT